ncbi:hypothetical protein CSAL01_09376 [Colletotrichum salicis]|uniref:Uncharacterized protein n=1 Tax=Colletotrichum salicis TaxID=1209931 RepID=A0A135SLW3_9PEZI|nr:hypothetical protein CSAL01_09376 [Colletotrichum salicis]
MDKEEEKNKEKRTVPPVDLSNEDEIEELPSSAIPAAVAAAAARAAARAADRPVFLAGHGHRRLAALLTEGQPDAEGRSPALARPPVSAAPTSAQPAARAVAAAAPVLRAPVAAPASRAANGLASSASSADSGSSASVGSLFDDEDLQGRSSQGLNGRASRKDHRLCKFKIYQRRQRRSKYANVYRCRGYPKNPALKNFLYCSRERKCLHKSNFKDKDGKINLKNCANCRASTQTAKIKDENEREARKQQLLSEFNAVPFTRGSGEGRNLKGKKKGLGKKKYHGKKTNSARKGKATKKSGREDNETESEVESDVEPLGMDQPDQRPGINKRHRDEDSDDDNYGANGKGGFSGFGGGNGAVPVAAC